MTTENWSSINAQNNMDLSWNYNGVAIQPDQVKEITLTLSVNTECPELSNFEFNIVIIGA